MALTFSKAAPLKPDIRLAQAVSQYEAGLSDGQKIAFRNERTQALKSPPGTKDVMRITAEIDISQKAGGRCFGPRFTKFLHGVQQFAALGDVVVGSSQNVVACGVWTVVRMCLLVTTNRASYIENLSLVLMEAGRSTQQHSDVALLYPRSKPLQTYITEYFIVVVQICLRFHRFAQKSILGKFTSSLNDTDIKDARSSLVAWSKSIQAEVGLLVAQRIESEAEHGSRFRAVMSSRSKSVSQQQKQIALRDLLDSCSIHDYETAWRQIRKAGNTSLYKQLPEYSQWLTSHDSKTLILVGKLGYGKSVTLANIVDDLNLRIMSESSGLAYFFCRHDVPESMVAKTVIGALVRQFIRPFTHLFDVPAVAETNDISRLLDLMRHIVPPSYVGYVVLDGLDLCTAQERETITEQLELMRSCLHVHICISRRLEPGAELVSIATDFPQANVVTLPNNSRDIEAFIAAQLEIALSNQSLALSNPAIVLDIQDTLLQGSQGMFLWVVLQIQSLCTMQTDHQIREALADLPRDLSQIYGRILQQAKLGQSSQADIFKLVLAARRPLTVHEMREALSVTPGNTTWDPSKLINRIYLALATCGCLITIDEEEHTIRTVHPSVNQFLLQDKSTSSTTDKGIHFTMEDAQTLISSIIITYLGYGIFGTEVAVRLPALNVGAAPSQIISSTIATSRSVQNMALKLLISRKQPNFDASRAFMEEATRATSPCMDDFHLKHYADAYIMQHLTTLPAILCDIPDNVFRSFKQYEMGIGPVEDASGLLWLMLQPHGRADIVDIFESMSVGPALKPWSDRIGFAELFHWAIRIGHVHATQYLLAIYRPLLLNYEGAIRGEGGIVPPALGKFCKRFWGAHQPPSRARLVSILFGSTPLCFALHERQDAIAKILIENELIDINQDTAGSGLDIWEKPIGVAMKQGNTGILKLLLVPRFWVRLKLTVVDVEVLLVHAQKLDDGSVASLLQRYFDDWKIVDKDELRWNY